MIQGLKVVQRLIGCKGPAPGYAPCWKVPPSFQLLGGWLRACGHPLPPPESPGQAQPKLPLAVETEALDPMWALPREYFCESIIRQMGKESVRGRNAEMHFIDHRNYLPGLKRIAKRLKHLLCTGLA